MPDPSPSPATTRTLSAAPSFRLHSPSLNALRLRRVFDLFDANSDGEISLRELSQALDRLGLGADDSSDLAEALKPYIRPGGTGICYEDFESFHRDMADRILGGVEGEEVEEEEEMREAFRVFDEDGDGFISAKELQTVLDRLGLPEGRSLDRVRQMIDAVDRDKDGQVDFGEFKGMMKNIQAKAENAAS